MATTIQTADINAIVQQAVQTAKDASNAAANSGIGQNISNTLINSSSTIHSIIDSITQNGVITPNELSQLNEEMALAKLNTLKAQTQTTYNRYGIIIGGIIVLIGGLWLITNKKTKDGQ